MCLQRRGDAIAAVGDRLARCDMLDHQRLIVDLADGCLRQCRAAPADAATSYDGDATPCRSPGHFGEFVEGQSKEADAGPALSRVSKYLILGVRRIMTRAVDTSSTFHVR